MTESRSLNLLLFALNKRLEGRWIGRRGSIEWPARSPDLTPMNFFLWRFLKNKVYVPKPATLEQLKLNIESEFRRLNNDPELLKRVCLSVTDRINKCIEVEGKHFEHSK